MWMTEDQGTAIKEFVNSGNGFYALHNCSHISIALKKLPRSNGGRIHWTSPLFARFGCGRRRTQHPITQGMSDFIVNDEQHYVEYDKDKKFILMEAENVDGLTFWETSARSQYPAGLMTLEVGESCSQPSVSTIHAMWNPQYLEIQKRSIKWLLKQI